MRIVSWNVNGIRAAMKKGFHDFVKKDNPDILCIQETKAQESDFKAEMELLTDYHFYTNSAERKGYSGTAILSKLEPKSVVFGMEMPEHEKEGRIITLEYADFYLVNVYVPNSGRELVRLDYREEWDAAFRKYLAKLQKKKPLVLTGDFNVAHEPIDLARPKPNYNKTAGYTQREIDDFDELLGIGLTDTFRHFYPEEVKYSFWSMMFGARKKNVGWRIDYFLVSNGFMEKVKDSFIMNEVMGSDHCPVGIDLNV